MHFSLTFFALCYLVLVFSWLGKEKANLSAFRIFVRFALIWFCLFPLPLGVCKGLRLVIITLPGLFSYFFFVYLFIYFFFFANHVRFDLSVSSSSWYLGRASICNCDTPWTFLLSCFFLRFNR